MLLKQDRDLHTPLDNKKENPSYNRLNSQCYHYNQFVSTVGKQFNSVRLVIQTVTSVCTKQSLCVICRIAAQHSILTNTKGAVTLTPKDGLVLHNGEELKKAKTLKHLDR